MGPTHFILSFPFCVPNFGKNEFLLVLIPFLFLPSIFFGTKHIIKYVGYRNVTANNNTDLVDEDSDSYKLI